MRRCRCSTRRSRAGRCGPAARSRTGRRGRSAVGGVAVSGGGVTRVVAGVVAARKGAEERVGVEAAGRSVVVPDMPGVGVLVVHQLLSPRQQDCSGSRSGRSQGKQWPRLYPAVCEDDNLRQVLRSQETGNRPPFGGRQAQAWLYVRVMFYFRPRTSPRWRNRWRWRCPLRPPAHRGPQGSRRPPSGARAARGARCR